MGVGTPDDLLGGIERGVDMFDCVMPTRAGRTARAYTERGTLNMRNARHAEDNRPISRIAIASPVRATAAPICIISSAPMRSSGRCC